VGDCEIRMTAKDKFGCARPLKTGMKSLQTNKRSAKEVEDVAGDVRECYERYCAASKFLR
jgi:hypothetical protein